MTSEELLWATSFCSPILTHARMDRSAGLCCLQHGFEAGCWYYSTSLVASSEHPPPTCTCTSKITGANLSSSDGWWPGRGQGLRSGLCAGSWLHCPLLAGLPMGPPFPAFSATPNPPHWPNSFSLTWYHVVAQASCCMSWCWPSLLRSATDMPYRTFVTLPDRSRGHELAWIQDRIVPKMLLLHQFGPRCKPQVLQEILNLLHERLCTSCTTKKWHDVQEELLRQEVWGLKAAHFHEAYLKRKQDGRVPSKIMLKGRRKGFWKVIKQNIWSNMHHYQVFTRNALKFHFQLGPFDAENWWEAHLHNKTPKTIL